MYLLSILLFVLISMIFLVTTSGGSVGFFVSPSSLILLLLIAIPLLVGAGLLKDFNNAFRLSAGQNVSCSRTELQRAIEAVSFTIKALWVSGIFNVVLELIVVLAMETEPLLVKYLSITLLPLMYAIVFIILLLPVKSRLTLRLYELQELPAAADDKNP